MKHEKHEKPKNREDVKTKKIENGNVNGLATMRKMEDVENDMKTK